MKLVRGECTSKCGKEFEAGNAPESEGGSTDTKDAMRSTRAEGTVTSRWFPSRPGMRTGLTKDSVNEVERGELKSRRCNTGAGTATMSRLSGFGH